MDWFNFLKKDLGVYMERHKTDIGGFDADAGWDPIAVEVDERGELREGHWVFWGI